MAARGRKRAVTSFTIAGRAFELVGPTSALHDAKAVALATEMGFFETSRAGESMEDFVARQVTRMNSSGRMVELLGYVAMPAGSRPDQWDEDMAAATSDFLGRVWEPADRDKVDALLANAVTYFFALARKSSADSPGSSKLPPIPNLDPRRADPAPFQSPVPKGQWSAGVFGTPSSGS